MMIRKLFLGALLAFICHAARAGNAPVTFQIDRALDPSPVCVLRKSSGACAQIGAVSSTNIWTPSGPNGAVFATSAYVDATNAANITSGLLPSARLPIAGPLALGAVYSGAAPASQFQTGIGSDGRPTFAQPALPAVTGVINNTQVPSGLTVDAPNLTGIPKTPSLTGYLYGNGGTGWTASPNIPAAALSGVTLGGDVSGTLQAVTINPNAVTAAKMFQAPAATLRGNPGGSAANVSDNALTAYIDAAFGSARGSLLYRGASGWGAITPSTAGYALFSNGPGADPSYQAVSVAATTPRGYLSGLTLANNATNPTTQLDIASGVATADDNTIPINLAATITKTMTAWSVGSGNGALDTGSAASNTWYHVFLIQRTDTNVADVLFSTSPTSPMLPSSYTKKRRVGSVRTTGTATNFAQFVQTGDEFVWAVGVMPVAEGTSIANGTSALITLSAGVPTGVKVKARTIGTTQCTAAGAVMNIYSPDSTALGAPTSVQPIIRTQVANGAVSSRDDILTDTSASVRIYNNSAGGTQTWGIGVSGWIDLRGK